ncbi:hypothetical protein [Lactococcus lactis]|uniref:hypothetical protein n=1 Tax=Lactococcus lactis TaxID=1358 RepID=UPI00223AD428|nr:hypothetical protein [Lactococcus lactis]
MGIIKTLRIFLNAQRAFLLSLNKKELSQLFNASAQAIRQRIEKLEDSEKLKTLRVIG